MGNSSDYITIKEAARALGKPVSWVKESICRGELGGMLTESEWLVDCRDLDKLKRRLPPESEKIIHDFLADIPPKKPQCVSRAEPTIKAREASATKSGASKSTPTESELRKRIKDLDKQIREINDQIRTESEKHRKAVRSGGHSSKTCWTICC